MAEPEDEPADAPAPADAPRKPRRRPPARRTPSKAPASLVAGDAAADVVHGAVEVGRGAVDAAKEVAEDVLGLLLDILEGIAGTVRRAIAAVMAIGILALALAAFAALQPDPFRQAFPYIFALFMGVLGVLFLWLGWRLQGATSSVMTIARIARKWRDRAARRG